MGKCNTPRDNLDISIKVNKHYLFQPGTFNKATLPGIIAATIGVGLFIAGMVIGTGGALGLALTIAGAATMAIGVMISLLGEWHHNKQEKEKEKDNNSPFDFSNELPF